MNKNSLKKLLFLCLAIPFAAVALWGCSSRDDRPSDTGETKLKVVTTLFPYYDFTRQVAGDRVELTMVVPAGMDSHSFEPTPADVQTIREADVLICNGGALEHWLSQVLNAVDSSAMTVVTGMDYVDSVQEELVEGMEEEEHQHQEDGADHGGDIEYDEHIWTSPVNAMTLVEAIRDTLTEKDPENRSYYEERAKSYLDKLKKLDGEFRKVAENKKRDMIVVGDKFPFRYLADEYGLSYRAAFSGCSTDTEPSARTIAYLIDKMRLEQIPVIYYLELSSHRVSEIIAEETGAEPLLLHSCHNVSRREFDSGITYLELMEQNVINLTRGLDE
ncbi:MAG: metal ABC transporter substrate-binding protein [Hungatella sp.]|jgi:zinc transport system substrate-binding protein|nr:metal ABC transporter substrate-binding protein [Hungatella sp.]